MICQLVPAAQGGIRDFAISLKDALGDDGAELHAYARDGVHDLHLSSDTLLLHYSGYGYAKRGVPLWVLSDLRRRRAKVKRLGVYFHELYAFAPPWRSSFWLSPAQRWVARHLAVMSDFWMTNRESSARWLRRCAADKPNIVLPVFSNVMEMERYSGPRAPKVVVFGGASLRAETYRKAGDALFTWSRREGLEVHDIGPSIEDRTTSARLHIEGVFLHGRLEAQSVSRQLATAMFGLVSYPVEYVAKSGVFAAYCTHGVCPVLISQNHVLSDGLVASQHYWPGIPSGADDPGKAESIGRAAWQWYQSHPLARHVETLKHFVGAVPNDELRNFLLATAVPQECRQKCRMWKTPK